MSAASRASSKEGAPRVQSAARALSILAEVASSREGITATEIATKLGLNKSTVYHLLQTMRSAGFIARVPGGKYCLGLQAGVIAAGLERQLTLPDRVRAMVRDLARATGEAAYVAGWRDREIALFDLARGTHAVMVSTLRLGLLEDAHARAGGKLLLAHAPADLRKSYLAAHPPRALTKHTMTRNALEQEWVRIREQGYSTDLEEYELEVCCLATLVYDAHLPLAVSLSAPAGRFRRNFDRYLEAARQAINGTI